MIRTITRDPHTKSKAWFNHHNGTRLVKKQCQSCRIGKHDCRSIHCTCPRCGSQVPKEA